METGVAPAAEAARSPASDVGEPNSGARAHAGTPLKFKEPSALLDPRAAALNEKYQHGDKQDAGNNPDNHDTVHNHSSFFQQSVSKCSPAIRKESGTAEPEQLHSAPLEFKRLPPYLTRVRRR
jgi:hypothetical protein